MDIFDHVRARLPYLPLERDFSFARHTTIGCGGVADAVCFPRDTGEAARTLSFLRQEKIPYVVLGAGANVLPADGRYHGIVVRLSRLNALCASSGSVFAGAGATGGALLMYCLNSGLGGLEPFTGIPMTVGGGIAMNAGVAERHFGDVVKSVIAWEEGKLKRLTARECAFQTKDSLFLHGACVLSAELAAEITPRQESERRLRFFRLRRKKLPKGRSMGCVFVNPKGDFAGRLIERCGLKGKRVGGAYVASEHANFILNDGGTSADITALIALIKSTVYTQTNVLLREEIRKIP